MIYLDNAATTQMDDLVLHEMLLWMKDGYGNPGGMYKLGRDALDAVTTARERVAALFGCDPRNIVFTSGGTEGNNAAIRNMTERIQGSRKNHLLISETEHDSVVNAANRYGERMASSAHLTRRDGTVDEQILFDTAKRRVGACSVQYVNNETGAVNPVAEIGKFCIENGILFHTDCVQAAGEYPIRAKEIGCDFATISAHKIHGPKGIGALYVKDPELMHPLIAGGEDQEFGLRGGTENVSAIVGFGVAAELAETEREKNVRHISTLKDAFYKWLCHKLKCRGFPEESIHINGPSVTEGKVLNLRFDGLEGESLVLTMDALNVCISAGSACRSRNVEPSRTLLAMGLSEAEARQSVRVSFSRMNKLSDAVEGAELMAYGVAVLSGRA